MQTQPDFFDGGALAQRSIRISDQEAIALVRSHYGLDGSVTRFATEKDDTFCFTDRQRHRYTLKVANPAEPPNEIAFQIAVLRHIATVNPSLPVPRAIPNLDRLLQFPYRDSHGQDRQVHLLTFLEGTPLSEVDSRPRERELIGEVLAGLRLATANFSHEADSRELVWDVKHLLKLTPLLGEVSDPVRRRNLEKGLDRFALFQDAIAKCRTQVLHNDFSKSNIVVDRSKSEFVAGIIDFGDTVRTAVAIDVSTALVNQLPSRRTDDFFGAPLDVLRGYLRVADLTPDELALIPHLVMARVITRALLTTWRARLFPDNAPYIIRNTEQGWFQLEWFLEHSADSVSSLFVESIR
ncbi:phosphotransferase [Bradyrhizobium sp. dw_78]|uniref:phosphotransferase n=1 Tax=Bradyrhizobium sp. dw_78 TaxID=2719793 RepID=UPI001BD651FB|nr:phosphotransferase [Bradyrhizobium sp. dw_78]